MLATAAGDDALAAEARARQLFHDGVYGGETAAALSAAAHAEALVVRLGDRGDLAALLANNVGVLFLIKGDVGAARGRFAEAIARTEQDRRTDPVDRAGYRMNAAQVAEDMSVRAGLYGQAVELLTGALGPGHPTTLQARIGRAAQADPATAARELAEVRPYLLATAAARHEHCVEGLLLLAHAYEQTGRRAASEEVLRAAEGCLGAPRTVDDEAPMLAMRRLVRGLSGASGLRDLEDAAAAFAPHVALIGVAEHLAAARLGIAAVHIAGGRDAEARGPLEAVVAELSALPPGPEWLRRFLSARARVLLAGVLVRDPLGDRGRVVELLAAAEAVYREAAEQQENLAAVAAVRAGL